MVSSSPLHANRADTDTVGAAFCTIPVSQDVSAMAEMGGGRGKTDGLHWHWQMLQLLEKTYEQIISVQIIECISSWRRNWLWDKGKSPCFQIPEM